MAGAKKTCRYEIKSVDSKSTKTDTELINNDCPEITETVETPSVVDPGLYGWHSYVDESGAAYVKQFEGTVMAIFAKDLKNKADPTPFKETKPLDLTDTMEEWPARRSVIADSLPSDPFSSNPPLKTKTTKVRRCASFSVTTNWEACPGLSVTVADSTDLELLQMKETYLRHDKPHAGMKSIRPKNPKTCEPLPERPYTNDNQAKVKSKESTTSVSDFDTVADTTVPNLILSRRCWNDIRFDVPCPSVTKLWKLPVGGENSATDAGPSHFSSIGKSKPTANTISAHPHQGPSSRSTGQRLKPNLANPSGEKEKAKSIFEVRMRDLLKEEAKQGFLKVKPKLKTAQVVPAPAAPTRPRKTPKVQNFVADSSKTRSPARGMPKT